VRLRPLSLAVVCWFTLGCASDAPTCQQAAGDQAIAEDAWGAALAEAAQHEATLDAGSPDAVTLAEHEALHEHVLEARVEVIIATARAAEACP